jgi:hypothetical protein
MGGQDVSMVEPLDAERSGHRSGRQSSETRRLGIVPTLGLVALLAVGLGLALVDPFTLLAYVSYGSIGALLAIRRPRNPIGWLLIAIAFGFVGTTSTPGVDAAALAGGTVSTWEKVQVWTTGWTGSASYVCFFALMLIFPSGHLPEGPWRVPSQILLLVGAVLTVLTALAPTISFTGQGGVETVVVPNPFAVLPDLPLWSALPPSDAFLMPIIGLLVVGVGSIVIRYRRSTGVLRLQLQWLVAAVTLVVAAILVGLASLALFADVIGGLAWIPAIAAFPTVPIAVVVAVLRYRLLEIDRIVSRTVGYGLVTGILGVVYIGSILLLQWALVAVTQAQTIAVAASTLAVFALFQPLRRRVQRAVDRRFDRARFDADRTTAAFAERLREEVDIGTVAVDLQETVRAAIQPERLGLWLRTNAHGIASGAADR